MEISFFSQQKIFERIAVKLTWESDLLRKSSEDNHVAVCASMWYGSWIKKY